MATVEEETPHAHRHAASNWFLEALLKSFPPSREVELQILSSNELLPHQQRRRQEQQQQQQQKGGKERPFFAYIVNLSRTDEAGTHFVLLLHAPKHPGILFYLDPLALYHDPGPFRLFLEREQEGESVKQVQRLKAPLQDKRSWACGYFCLYFIYLGCLSDRKLTQLNLFPLKHEARRKNDCLLMQNLARVFSACMTQ